MATLICRYLFDEGTGTTLADSSGNGYDLTITGGTASSWSTLDGGTGWYNGDRTAGSKAQSETAHLAFDGLSQVTVVQVLQGMEGSSQMPRTWFIGSDGGNGQISTNVAKTENTTGRYEGRWMREPNDSNHVRYQFATVSYENYHVLIMEYDPVLDDTAGNRIKLWYNNITLLVF